MTVGMRVMAAKVALTAVPFRGSVQVLERGPPPSGAKRRMTGMGYSFAVVIRPVWVAPSPRRTTVTPSACQVRIQTPPSW